MQYPCVPWPTGALGIVRSARKHRQAQPESQGWSFMSANKVLLTSRAIREDDPCLLRLRAQGCEVVAGYWHEGRDEAEMISLLPDVGAVLASSGDPFTARVLARADSLRVISRTGVGYDAIDVPAATAKGIVVTITPGSNTNAVAELAFAFLLALSRRLLVNQRNVRQHRWVREVNSEVAGKTIGIVGLGAIGKRLAKRAAAFDMRILAHDPVQDAAFAATHGVTYAPLDDLLAEADFVSLHVPLGEATHHLIDEERLLHMKPSAYLINTSRGPVVDEMALYRMLKEGRIAGAGLDVFEREPPWNSPLLELDNVIVTPHMAGNSKEAEAAMAEMACENALRVLAGQPALHAVNPEAARARDQ